MEANTVLHSGMNVEHAREDAFEVLQRRSMVMKVDLMLKNLLWAA